MVAATEKQSWALIELVPTAVAAGKTNATLTALNPVGKVPTLVTGDW